MGRYTAAERMKRTRERRRRGQALAKIKVDREEVRKLVALGYLPKTLVMIDKGVALDKAVEAFLSDQFAEVTPKV